MAVKVGQRKDKPGWWVFIHYRGSAPNDALGKGRQGESKANEFAAKMKHVWSGPMQAVKHLALKQADQKMPTVADYLRGG